MKKNTSRVIATEGFTLIELVTVVVIVGIIGVMGADFISKGFAGFIETDSRLSAYEEGKIALVRMEREIHNAIPNAIDRSGPADLRFGMIDEVAMADVFGQYIESSPTNSITDLSAGLSGPPTVSIISIYNRNWADFTSTPAAPQRRLYTVTNLVGAEMTLSKPVTPPRSSPQQRYYAVDQAIRYFLAGTTLKRAQVAIDNSSSDIVSGLLLEPGFPLVKNVTNLSFSYSPGTLTRNGVVTIDFTISRNGDPAQESIDFHKEIHVRNVP